MSVNLSNPDTAADNAPAPVVGTEPSTSGDGVGAPAPTRPMPLVPRVTTPVADGTRGEAAVDEAGTQAAPATGRIEIESLSAFYGAFRAVRDVSMTIRPHAVTAIIGPSGCGKSTFLRSLNRMHELIAGARIEGRLLLDGTDLYDPAIDPVQLRRIVGMVFQRPNPFPTMSIYDNVVAGLRLTGRHVQMRISMPTVERCLSASALWDEVKDKLEAPWHIAVRWAAAAAVHCTGAGGGPGGSADGRAGVGARSRRDASGRGVDARAAVDLHDRHRHPQHAAGGTCQRPDRVLHDGR